MKSLPQQSAGQPEWDNSLLRDLAYIKKNLRYPISKKVLIPGILFALSLSAAAYVVIGIAERMIAKQGMGLGPVLLVISFTLLAVVSATRALGSLKFISISTPYDTNGNISLITKFLESQHLVVFRHPEAPEVFQIISRSIDVFKDAREVLVFIADDHRILINSHFTERNQTMQRHHKQMAEMLQQYMNGQ
ncbi:hypothetical protein ACTHGU_06410 [Chitinophagaceae bacterium MMS25-I14]